MSKRKSIGNDPLDWIGEQQGGSAAGAAPNGAALAAAEAGSAGESLTDLQSGSASPAAPGGFQLERQLLLVDGLLREGKARPRVNRALWGALLVLASLTGGIVLFRETRHQWNARVLSLETTIDRIEKERGRNERILEQVINQKDELIREKQGTIQKIEAVNQTAMEELRLARAARERLSVENQGLLERTQKDREAGLLGPREGSPPGPLPSSKTSSD
jgi:hypothetical protein